MESYHKWTAVGVGAGMGLVMATPLALSAAGFGSLGPVAGSCAAQWMSSITVVNGIGVQAGSTYAFLQTAGMTATVSVKAVTLGAAAGAGALAATKAATDAAPHLR